MIYGVVGTLDQNTMMKFGLYNIKTGRFQRVASKKGNGKTLCLVYYGFCENRDYGRKVYSNFHTKYSIYKPAQEIFEDLGRLLDLAGKYGAYGTIGEIIKNFDHIFAHYALSQTAQTELYEIRSLFTEYYGCLILLTEFQKYFNSLGTSTKTIKWIEGILTQLRKVEIDLMWDSQRPISAGNRSREYTETFLVPQKFHSADLSPCDKDICGEDHLIYVYSDIPFREKELVILDAKEVGALYDTNEIIGDNLCTPGEKSTEEKKEKKAKARKKTQAEEEAPEIPVITNRPPPEIEDPEMSPEEILAESDEEIPEASFIQWADACNEGAEAQYEAEQQAPDPVDLFNAEDLLEDRTDDNPFARLLNNPRIPDSIKKVSRTIMDSIEEKEPGIKEHLINETFRKFEEINSRYPAPPVKRELKPNVRHGPERGMVQEGMKHGY